MFGTGDVRIGAATVVQAIAEGRRAAYAVDAYLKGQDLAAIRTRQTLAEPQPEFLSIVPFTAEVKEPRYRMTAMEAEERNHNYIEYELPYTREEAVAESTRCLQCTCEAIGFCDLRRLGIEYGTTLKTLEPQYHQGAGYRSVTENRFTGINHDYIRDDSHAFILREPSRCIDCGRCANVCAEVVGAACYDFMRIGFDTLVTTPAGHEPQRHPVRVVRPLRRDVPDRRADAQAAHPPEVRGRREPLHPVRHLRRCLPLRRAARRRRHRARPHQPRGTRRSTSWPSPRSTARPRSPTSGASATGRPGPPPRAASSTPSRMLPVLPAAVTGVPPAGNGNGHGHAHGNGHDHGAVAALGPGAHGRPRRVAVHRVVPDPRSALARHGRGARRRRPDARVPRPGLGGRPVLDPGRGHARGRACWS